MLVTVPPPDTIYAFRATVTTTATSIASLAAAYQSSHAYVVGNVFSNAGILYAVTKAGTSGTTAPTGTGPSIVDADGGAGAPVYRALTEIRRVVVRNLDPSATIDAGNASVTAGGGLPIVGNTPIGETLVQEIADPAALYLVAASGTVAVALEVY